MKTSRSSSRYRAIAVTAAASLMLSMGTIFLISTPGTAAEDPDYSKYTPAELETEIARLQAEEVTARIAVAQSTEELTAAQEEQLTAQIEASSLKRVAQDADARFKAAQAELKVVVQFASRRGDADLNRLAPLLGAEDLTDAQRRFNIVNRISADLGKKLNRISVLRSVAQASQQMADDAENAADKQAEVVKDKVDAATEKAQALAVQQETAKQRRSELIRQLASKRETSLADAEKRAAEVEKAAKERIEAAERARVEAAAANAEAEEARRQAAQREEKLAAEKAERERIAELERLAAEKAREEREKASAAEREAAAKAAAEEARKQAEAEKARKAEEQRKADEARRKAEEQRKAEEARRAAEEAERAKTQNSGIGERALAIAKTRVGVPYLWGGIGKGGYDCSGLVYSSFAQAGKPVPRVATDQYWASKRVAIKDLQPGDLVFWGNGGSDKSIYHVAFYVGNGQILEAPYPGEVVKFNPLRYYDLLPYGGRF